MATMPKTYDSFRARGIASRVHEHSGVRSTQPGSQRCRRVEFINSGDGSTTRYFYDGQNEILETDEGGNPQRYYVHEPSYVDERVMLYSALLERPYYYVLDRMYDVWAILDRAGAIVERYSYDGYGRRYIRESAGRGCLGSA